MVFTPDTETALQAAAALVNTLWGGEDAGSDHGDGLASVADLGRFVTRWRWTGVTVDDETELAAVRDLRPRLAELWGRDEAHVVDLANTLAAEAGAVPRLVDHDGLGWHLHATPDDAPLATRMAVEAALAVMDVVRAGETTRLRGCEADGCRNLYVDLSRNRSRRFCGTTCGNRVAAAAYRGRRTSSTGDQHRTP